MADDWRVTITLSDAAHVRRAVQSLCEHQVEDDVRRRLGHHVAVSEHGPSVFLYASTEDAAREADRMVREVLSQHQLTAELTLDRWHPLEEDWEDANVPMPDREAQVAAEHQHLIDDETQQSREAGRAGWEVCVELPSHRQAVELARRLRVEGRMVDRRWKYLFVGADNEDDASALAEVIGREAPANASLRTQANPFLDMAVNGARY
jgi:hypothetical protein